MKKDYRHSIFYRFFLSHFLIATIPIILLWGILYYSMVVSLNHEIVRNNTGSIHQLNEAFNCGVKKMNEITAKISNDNLLSPYNVYSDRSGTNDTYKRLGLYANDDLFENVYIKFNNDDTLYSKNGGTNINNMGGVFYSRTGYSKKQFVEFINSTAGTTGKYFSSVRDVKGGYPQTSICVYSMSSGSGISPGKIIFILKQDKLQEYVNNLLYSEKVVVQLTDSRDASIFEYTNLDIKQDSFFEGLGEIEKNKQDIVYNENIVIGKEKYLVNEINDNNSGLNLYVGVQNKSLYYYVTIKAVFLIGLFSIIVLSVVFFCMKISRYNTGEIKLITRIIDSFLPNHDNGIDSELINFDSVKNSLLSIKDRYKGLEKALTKEKDENTSLIIERFLAQEDVDLDKIKRMIFKNVRKNENSRYCVFVVLFTEKLDMLRESLMMKIKEKFDENIIFFLSRIQDNSLVMIMQYSDNNIEILTQNVSYKLKSIVGTHVRMGVGQSSKDIEQLPHSYNQAIVALHIGDNDEDIVTYKRNESRVLWYQDEKLILLKQSINNIDLDRSFKIVDELQDTVNNKIFSIAAKKCIISDLTNLLIRLAEHHSCDMLWGSIDELVFSKENFFLLSKDFIAKIIEKVKENQENEIKNKDNEIIKYVDNNYLDNGFSIDKVAIEFDLSLSYVNNYFKHRYDKTFSSYVHDLRMEKFKNDLIKTNLPIKDIIFNIGYLDASNFIRKFRNQEGVTPGDYRKQFIKK